MSRQKKDHYKLMLAARNTGIEPRQKYKKRTKSLRMIKTFHRSYYEYDYDGYEDDDTYACGCCKCCGCYCNEEGDRFGNT